jgi:hypothetical protein
LIQVIIPAFALRAASFVILTPGFLAVANLLFLIGLVELGVRRETVAAAPRQSNGVPDYIAFAP